MQFEEFVHEVADRAGTSRDEAESLVRATLRTLAERLSGGEAEDLRAQLPRQLQAELIPPQEEAQGFGVVEFVQKSDPTVQKMLALREDIFDSYDEATFENALTSRARIVKLDLAGHGHTVVGHRG